MILKFYVNENSRKLTQNPRHVQVFWWKFVVFLKNNGARVRDFEKYADGGDVVNGIDGGMLLMGYEANGVNGG
jgi:hypothetical protein